MEKLFSADQLTEGIDLEAKLAGGRDGKGKLPNDVWETYSAFANTRGGVILLGVKEHEDGSLEALGIENPQKVLDELWNGLNNPQKASVNLLSEANVTRHLAPKGRYVLEIAVPIAPRQQKPVFINSNPLKGTYRRENAGDYLCTEPEVKLMLAEQQQEARDARLLEGFTLEDIHAESLKAYRNRLAVFKPDHPFNLSDDQEFLRQLGGWKKDRRSGVEGLTLAGLLMFGKQEAITEAMPHFFLDYREVPLSGAKTEWTDRLTPDGTWAGNLYEFYRLATQKLSRDLKIPFKMEGGARSDDTPIHKAIREALVNALVHADYALPTSLLVIKAPDYFEFRNPGKMRVPIEQAIQGGHSDCRNRSLQKMFNLIGLGEQAGSGVPRVIENWHSLHYRFPELWESDQPETTSIKLRTVSLIPEETIAQLSAQFRNLFTDLAENERLAVVTAEIEGYVSNQRLQLITHLHPSDITQLLQQLVKTGILVPSGKGRGRTYSVKGADVDAAMLDEKSQALQPRSLHLADSSEHLADSSEHLVDSSEHLVDSSEHLPPEEYEKLVEKAELISGKRKASVEEVKETILALCENRFLTLAQLATLLNRSPDGLRQRYVKPMVDGGSLCRRFPNNPNHERQAYSSTKNS